MNALAAVLVALLFPPSAGRPAQESAPEPVAEQEQVPAAEPVQVHSAVPAEQTPRARSSNVHTSDEPVKLSLWHRPITTFRATYKDTTPRRRADRALERLSLMSEDDEWEVKALEATIGELSGYVIIVDGTTIFGLLEEDLDPVSSPSLEEVANDAAAKLHGILEERWRARRPRVLLRGAGFVGLASLVFGILLRLLSRTVTFLANRVPKLLPKLNFSWRPWGFDLRDALGELRYFLIRLLSLVVGLGLTYAWVTFSLAQFPYTEPWSDDLGFLLLTSLRSAGDGAMNAIPGLFLVFIIFSITKMVTRLMGSFFTAIEHGATRVSWLERETAKATRRIVTVMIWLFALMFAYPYIPGSGTTAFKGISVFVGLLVTVGSTGLVNQVMSGLVVLYSRTLKAGDYVKIGEDEGIVTGVGFLSTRISTPTQEEIIIPNAVLTGKITRNLSHINEHDGVVASTSVTIGYDTPWRQVVEVLLDAAQRTPHVRDQPAPYVRQGGLSDFYVHYELIFHVEQPAQRARALTVLHQEILDAFNAASIQIMSPHFNVQPDEAVLVAGDQPQA